ncbi:metal ABC transporter ATP-binding protein [Georgenia halophila]|uniref:Metal ABC transporter ATP-binding protein n=1 Tax=Georgenia halophila TaxID=620889 RepID=A0ABP8LQP4_9MICO
MSQAPRATADPALEVQNLSVRYGAVTALDGVTLDLRPGTVTGLVGMNGSGKSTLFKSVMGLVPPESGSIRLLGGPAERARRRGAVAYTPQSEDVDWSFPVCVRDVVRMGRYGRLGLTRRLRRGDEEQVAGALERVGLSDLADRQVGALSGGQRKRVFVARALAQEADVLLLDEPFAGVDRLTEDTLTALLRTLAAEGRTVLISTHDLQNLDVLCDDAVLLHRRVILHASPREVLRPENLALAFGAADDGTTTSGVARAAEREVGP